MSLLNGTQKIVVADDEVKIISNDGFVVSEGRTIEECMSNFIARLKQEYIQKQYQGTD